MINNKELILILSYCPTKEKKEILFEFLKSLQKFRNEYDILVASHTTLDSWFFEYFDYFFFDKKNELLTDIEYRQNAWFSPWDDYVIWSSYIEVGNTHKAIWDMIIPSVNIANCLNYNKIHMFEYDVKINENKELKDNSELLNEYDYVIYGDNTTHQLIGGFISFKTNMMIDEYKKIDNNIYEKMYVDKYPKVPENITAKLIQNQRTFIKKDPKKIKDNGLEISKMRGNPFDWNVPFYDKEHNKLKFLSRNLSNEPFDIKVITNGILHNLGKIEPGVWKIVDLIDFEEIKDLIVLKNNDKILRLIFDSDDYKQRFVKYNSVLTNESLQIK